MKYDDFAILYGKRKVEDWNCTIKFRFASQLKAFSLALSVVATALVAECQKSCDYLQKEIEKQNKEDSNCTIYFHFASQLQAFHLLSNLQTFFVRFCFVYLNGLVAECQKSCNYLQIEIEKQNKEDPNCTIHFHFDTQLQAFHLLSYSQTFFARFTFVCLKGCLQRRRKVGNLH